MEEKEQEVATMTDPKGGYSNNNYDLHNTSIQKTEPPMQEDADTPQEEAKVFLQKYEERQRRLFGAMEEAVSRRF